MIGCAVRTTKGQADENEGHHGAERRQQAAQPAVGGVERGQRNAGDGGRQSEGHIDDRVEDAAPGKR